MAVQFITTQPKELIAAFDARIHQPEQKGKVTTWKRLVFQGVTYYTHTAAQWREKAFFAPAIEQGQLSFYIIKPASENVSLVVYGYYHGHLTETFLSHFDDMFTRAVSTAKAIVGDNVSS